MNPHTLKHRSKQLSWLLRHGANESGLDMDPAGWARTADVLRLARISPAQLDAIVAQNDKQRLQVRGDRIRATQGHSLDGTPVTRDALEESWVPYARDALVWHGTHVNAIEGIAAEGIRHCARSHVHLASSTESKVGKRWNVSVLLGICPARMRARGWPLWVSPNGVILTRHVPADCIVAIKLRSKGAKKAEPRLRALLGLVTPEAPPAPGPTPPVAPVA
ncbi:MAG: RNA 2'-phosphotransferase [Alphaproteobacteria bacterium]|nr:RNA 2'-phosphotransferase [Alphaproteobacteria bacterium]